MMKINIIAVGKIKEDYLTIGINEYIKRIAPYSKIEIIEIKDFPCKDNIESEINKCKIIEGELILSRIKKDDYVITLDLNKKQLKSEEFAKFLQKSFDNNGSKITFVIGGSYGLSDEVKCRSNFALSLSEMTFLHQMSRLILLEQIYRSFKILNNEVYHK